jgi:hypothetical protein
MDAQVNMTDHANRVRAAIGHRCAHGTNPKRRSGPENSGSAIRDSHLFLLRPSTGIRQQIGDCPYFPTGIRQQIGDCPYFRSIFAIFADFPSIFAYFPLFSAADEAQILDRRMVGEIQLRTVLN